MGWIGSDERNWALHIWYVEGLQCCGNIRTALMLCTGAWCLQQRANIGATHKLNVEKFECVNGRVDVHR